MPLQLLEDFTIRTAAISGSVDINTGTMHHVYTATTEAMHKYYRKVRFLSMIHSET